MFTFIFVYATMIFGGDWDFSGRSLPKSIIFAALYVGLDKNSNKNDNT